MHGMRRELKPIKGDGEIGDEARQAMKEERERILRSARHNMQLVTRRATCNAACNMQHSMQHATRRATCNAACNMQRRAVFCCVA